MNGQSFYYDEDLGITYRNLGFIGCPYYRVGDDGSVWSCLEMKSSGYCGIEFSPDKKWKKLSPMNFGSRLGVSLHKTDDGKIKVIQVSHLVLLAFHGPKPNGYEACHFPDSNSFNNDSLNLVWATHKENMRHRSIHGHSQKGKTYVLGENSHNAKLNDDIVRECRKRYKEEDISKSELARIYNVSIPTMGCAIDEVTWKHVK